MQFEYHTVNRWPPLAWLASCQGDGRIILWHGPGVETHTEWFCEAVWPGAFNDGNFDRTDLVAGTGGRCRGNGVHFVAPGNTVDRLLSLHVPASDALLVSNSLPCLLGTSGASIDPSYPRYYDDFATIVRGLAAYKRTLSTSLGDIGIIVFGRLIWNGHSASTTHWDAAPRDFSTFERYESFLRENLVRFALNATDPSRKRPYRLLATVSSGYDSPAVAALARAAGCEEALCIDTDRFGEPEPGANIAERLGLRVVRLARNRWRELDSPEILFISADGTAEAVPLAGAAPDLSGRVLLTGYHGDKVWAKQGTDLSDNIVRGDSSGLSLSEYRLWTGFIHCPIPFWGVRQIADINRLSNSAEMRQWEVSGDYSRPIPRRIVESAQVPRNAFGTTKRASAVAFSDFLSPRSLDAYRQWLAAHRLDWVKRGRLPPPLSETYERIARRLGERYESALHATPALWRLAPANAVDRASRLRRHAFAWAVGDVSSRYGQHFPPSSVKSRLNT